MQKACVIVIDPQKDFISAQGNYSRRHPAILQILDAKRRINQLIGLLDKDNIVIVFSDYEQDQFGAGLSLCIPGTPGHEIDIAIDASFKQIPKTQHSCFSSAAFVSYLKDNNFERLILCGFLAEYCVKATAIDALKTGYAVSVLVECVGTGDDVQQKKDQTFDELRSLNVELISSLRYPFERYLLRSS